MNTQVDERTRMLAENQRRREEIDAGLYQASDAAELFIRQGRVRLAARLLSERDVFPRAGSSCLEIGCGTLGWLGELLAWGLREGDLHGIELDPVRLDAGKEALPGADLRVGDATNLPWASETFDLVITSTVLTSVLDKEVRREIAVEAERVLRPGGALLWYDFRRNNPGNPSVRRVTATELRDLFPGLSGPIRSATLAPPLTRVLASRAHWLAHTLELLPVLRTHLLAVLTKPGSQS